MVNRHFLKTLNMRTLLFEDKPSGCQNICLGENWNKLTSHCFRPSGYYHIIFIILHLI